MNQTMVHAKMTWSGRITMGLFMFFLGGMVYVLFRPMSLIMFSWFTQLGLETIVDKLRQYVIGLYVPDFVLYSLPDGLYVASYIVIMDTIWRNSSQLNRLTFVSVLPLFCIFSEIAQWIGFVRGTFDVMDLLCYSLPLIFYLSSAYNKK